MCVIPTPSPPLLVKFRLLYVSSFHPLIHFPKKGGSVNATIWAEIEGGTGIICACLPALRAPCVRLYRYCIGRSSNDTSSRSRTYNEFHEIDKTQPSSGSRYDADGTVFDFADPPPLPSNNQRKSGLNDPWGDAIPLSTAQATATRGGRSSDDDSEERVMGITKTVGFDVSNV